MLQAAAINSTITRLQNELALNEKVIALLPDSLKSQALIINTQLYGATASLLFKGSKVQLSHLLEVFAPVISQKWKGVFDYTIPETYDILNEKDSKATKQGDREATAIMGCHSFKLDFYATLEGHLFNIELDFMDVIIGNRYSSLATGKKLPHLRENTLYTKDGRRGTRYFGVNGAGDTNHYEIRQAMSFDSALELLK